MENFLKQYRDLEMRVLNELKSKVNQSKYESNYINNKAIKVSLSDKVELVIVNDELTFIDERGLYQSVFNESLEDLIILLKNL
jgi:hypothetical protein